MDMMRSTDRHGRSLLALAAMSGSKETFATVLSILVDELGEDKVGCGGGVTLFCFVLFWRWWGER